jgi:hypothetical protein
MIEVSQPEQQTHPTKIFKLIAVGFVILAALIAAFSLYVVFSRAQVVVLSEAQEIEHDLIVDVAALPNEGEVAGGVYQLSKSATQTFAVDSVVTIDMSAEGKVRISSDLYRDQTLIASTRLLTSDEVMFRLKKTVIIPAFGSVEAEVFSDEAGVVTALPEGETFSIPGLNEETSKFFTVESVGTMVGGQKDMRLVTASDMVAAEKTIVDRLESEIKTELRRRAQETGTPMSGDLFDFKTTLSNSDVAVGDEAEQYTLSVTVDGRAIFYDHDQFQARVRQMLSDKLPFDRMLTSLELEKSCLKLEKSDLIGKRANVRVAARGSSVLSVEAAGLDPEKLVGVTADAATEYLETLDGVSSASVKLRPFWARRLPNTADHIEVEVR